MSVVLNGSSQYLYLASQVAGGTPFTVFVWFKTTSDTLNQVIAAEDVAAVSGYKIHGSLEASGGVASDPVRAYNYDGGGYGIAVSTAGYTANSWQSACGIFTSATSRDAFVNGGSKGSNTDNRTGDSDEFTVGCRRGNSPIGYFVGKIAHVAVWDKALSDANVSSLHGGANPLTIESGNLIAYWPLNGNATATVGSNLNESGSPSYDTGDNPSVDAPPGMVHAVAYLSGEGSIVVSPHIFVHVAPYLSGTGSVVVVSSVININNLGATVPAIGTIIQPGWDSDCNQGSADNWNNSVPKEVDPPISVTDSEQVVKSPMDQDAHNGAGIVDSVESLWFEVAHLLPRLTQDVGNVATEQTLSCELYNANRTESITVSSITDNLGTGFQVTGVPTPPFTILSQRGLEFDITISSSGELNFDSTYTFTLSTGEEYTVRIIGSRIILLPIRPEAPLKEHLIFDTKIIEAVSGSEQRIANRSQPRSVFEMTVRDDRRRIELLLFDRQSKIVAIPAWHEPSFLSSAGSVDDLTVNVDTTAYGNFYVGGYAIVFKDKYTYDALKIESMTSTSLTFESGLTYDYSINTQVMPLMTAYLEATTSATKAPVNDQTFKIKAYVETEENDIADTSGWSIYNGKVFLDDPNMISGSLPESLETKVYVLDNVTGNRSNIAVWEHNLRRSRKGFKTNSRAELWKLRQLLHYLKGKQVSFYIPTFSRDIEPNQTMLNASTTFTMDNIGYTVNAYQRWPKQVIRVHLTDGTILVRTIQNSAEVSASVEQLTVDTAWPYDIEPEDIDRIEFLEKVRLDEDDIVITHYNALGQAECTPPTRETMD